MLGKSLKTVLDEGHVVVNLYSFPLHLASQGSPSLPQVSHLNHPTIIFIIFGDILMFY